MSTRPHTAMVFAAGLGKRMRPLTETTPKPLIKVEGRTMLDRALDHLVKAGVKRAVVNTHYLAGQIPAHLKSRKDIEILYSHEPVLLETGGGLKQALPMLGNDPIYVLNSDVVLLDGESPALPKLAAAWEDARMDLLLLLAEKENAIGYEGAGDFALDAAHALTRPEPPRPYVFTGIQILKPALVKDTADDIFSLNRFYFDNPRAHGLVHDGGWLHIGTPQGLAEAESYLKSTSKIS